MAFDAHTNLAYATVATAPAPASSGLSLVVGSGLGALFPAAPFNCTVWPAGASPLETNAEIIRVTAVVGDTFTIVRSQEGTSARSILVGDQIAATITVKTITDLEAFLKGWTNDGGNPASIDTGGGSITIGGLGGVLELPSPSFIQASDAVYELALTSSEFVMFNTVTGLEVYKFGAGLGIIAKAPATIACFLAGNDAGATVALDAGSLFIVNVEDPVNPQDAATKHYIDSKLTGFGDGSDGSAAFDGTTAVAGATTTGASPNKVYTLTRDVYYTTMTVSAGKTLNTGGFRIFVQGVLTNAGTIQNVGGAGAGTTAGAAAPGGSVAGGGAGAAGTATGTTTVAGTAAGNTNAGYSNIGGRGGSGGGTSPGAAGTVSTIARVAGWRDVFSAGDLMWAPPAAAITSAPGAVVIAGGGTGGGGGGRVTGGTTTATGAGGGGGGVVFIAAGSIVNTGTISAAGGAGGNATGGTSSAGGGGGGGGGAIVLIYNLFSNSGTISAPGGAVGTGLNGAAAAAAGSAGVVIEIPA